MACGWNEHFQLGLSVVFSTVSIRCLLFVNIILHLPLETGHHLVLVMHLLESYFVICQCVSTEDKSCLEKVEILYS